MLAFGLSAQIWAPFFAVSMKEFHGELLIIDKRFLAQNSPVPSQ
jgi:hypothetical protein